MSLPTSAPSGGAHAWFRGGAAVTGVGSLPHTEPARAIDFIATHAPEVPFWPQLRRLSPREAMIPQSLGPAFRHVSAVRGEFAYTLASDRVDRFALSLEREAGTLDPANAAGFHAFVAALAAGAFPHARAVKAQAMGPVTLACSLLVDGLPCVDRADVRALLAAHVGRLVSWQCDTLRRHAASVLMVLDEAYLGMALRQKPERRAAAVELLRSVVLRVRRPGVLVGLHCCDEMPLSLLNETGVDLVSFDAHHGADVFAHDADALHFLDNGGRVAWGWVPTRDDLSGFAAGEVVDRWWTAASGIARARHLDPRRLFEASLVTASCGLAGSSEATCARSFGLAREIRDAFAERLESGAPAL